MVLAHSRIAIFGCMPSSAGGGLWSENARFPTKHQPPAKKRLARRPNPPTCPIGAGTGPGRPTQCGDPPLETDQPPRCLWHSGRIADILRSWPADLSSVPDISTSTCAKASLARMASVSSCPSWHSLPEVPVSPHERYPVDYEHVVIQWVGWHWASLQEGGI